MAYTDVDGNDVDGNGKETYEPSVSTASTRKVLSEEDILATECRNCHAIVNVGCKNKSRHPLVHTEASTELAFHRERIMDAWAQHSQRRMGPLNATDKALITYYAFIMLCDSVSTKAVELLGEPFTSEDIQKFFAMKAVAELKKDKLLG